MDNDETEYVLSNESTNRDIRDVLTALKTEAKERAATYSSQYARYMDESSRSSAMYHFGQIELLEDLIWTLGPDPELENCKPVIRLRNPKP